MKLLELLEVTEELLVALDRVTIRSTAAEAFLGETGDAAAGDARDTGFDSLVMKCREYSITCRQYLSSISHWIGSDQFRARNLNKADEALIETFKGALVGCLDILIESQLESQFGNAIEGVWAFSSNSSVTSTSEYPTSADDGNRTLPTERGDASKMLPVYVVKYLLGLKAEKLAAASIRRSSRTTFVDLFEIATERIDRAFFAIQQVMVESSSAGSTSSYRRKPLALAGATGFPQQQWLNTTTTKAEVDIMVSQEEELVSDLESMTVRLATSLSETSHLQGLLSRAEGERDLLREELSQLSEQIKRSSVASSSGSHSSESKAKTRRAKDTTVVASGKKTSREAFSSSSSSSSRRSKLLSRQQSTFNSKGSRSRSLNRSSSGALGARSGSGSAGNMNMGTPEISGEDDGNSDSDNAANDNPSSSSSQRGAHKSTAEGLFKDTSARLEQMEFAIAVLLGLVEASDARVHHLRSCCKSVDDELQYIQTQQVKLRAASEQQQGVIIGGASAHKAVTGNTNGTSNGNYFQRQLLDSVTEGNEQDNSFSSSPIQHSKQRPVVGAGVGSISSLSPPSVITTTTRVQNDNSDDAVACFSYTPANNGTSRGGVYDILLPQQQQERKYKVSVSDTDKVNSSGSSVDEELLLQEVSLRPEVVFDLSHVTGEEIDEDALGGYGARYVDDVDNAVVGLHTTYAQDGREQDRAREREEEEAEENYASMTRFGVKIKPPTTPFRDHRHHLHHHHVLEEIDSTVGDDDEAAIGDDENISGSGETIESSSAGNSNRGVNRERSFVQRQEQQQTSSANQHRVVGDDDADDDWGVDAAAIADEEEEQQQPQQQDHEEESSFDRGLAEEQWAIHQQHLFENVQAASNEDEDDDNARSVEERDYDMQEQLSKEFCDFATNELASSTAKYKKEAKDGELRQAVEIINRLRERLHELRDTSNRRLRDAAEKRVKLLQAISFERTEREALVVTLAHLQDQVEEKGKELKAVQSSYQQLVTDDGVRSKEGDLMAEYETDTLRRELFRERAEASVWQRRLSLLEMQLAVKDEELFTVRDSLTKELEKSNEQLHDADRRASRILAEFHEASKSFEDRLHHMSLDHATEKDRHIAALEQLRMEVEEQKEICATIQREAAVKESQMQSEIEFERRENEALVVSLAHLEANMRKKESEFSGVIETFNKQLLEQNEQHKDSDRSLISAVEMMQSIREELNVCKEEKEANEKKYSKLLADEETARTTEVYHLTEKLRAAEHVLAVAQGAGQKSREDLHAIESLLDERTKELTTARDTFTVQLQQKTEETLKQSARADIAEAHANEMGKVAANLRGDLEESRAVQQARQREKESRESEFQTTVVQLIAEKNAYEEESVRELQLLRQEVNSLQQQLSQVRTEKSELQRNVNPLIDSNNSLADEVKALQTEVTNLRNRCSSLHSEKSELKGYLGKAQRDFVEASNILAIAQAKVVENEKLLIAVEPRASELALQLTLSQRQVSDLENVVSLLKHEIAMLRVQLTMKGEVHSTSGKLDRMSASYRDHDHDHREEPPGATEPTPDPTNSDPFVEEDRNNPFAVFANSSSSHSTPIHSNASPTQPGVHYSQVPVTPYPYAYASMHAHHSPATPAVLPSSSSPFTGSPYHPAAYGNNDDSDPRSIGEQEQQYQHHYVAKDPPAGNGTAVISPRPAVSLDFDPFTEPLPSGGVPVAFLFAASPSSTDTKVPTIANYPPVEEPAVLVEAIRGHGTTIGSATDIASQETPENTDRTE